MEFISKLTPEMTEEREQLIFGRPYSIKKYIGGISRFKALDVDTAKELLAKGYIDPDDTQNNSPTNREMIDFCDDGSGRWFLHGYAVSPDRGDCRVSFEGVMANDPLTKDDIIDFLRMFRYADELDVDEGSAWSWYD